MIKWQPYNLPARWRKWGGRLEIKIPWFHADISINVKQGGFYSDRDK